jgi:hypothetical protein
MGDRMTVQPARKRKPSAADEAARVLTIFEMLCDEIAKRQGFPLVVWHDAKREYVADSPTRAAVLTVANSIAARTED